MSLAPEKSMVLEGLQQEAASGEAAVVCTSRLHVGAQT